MPSFLGKIHLILTIRCDDASHLASDALDRPLAWYERWALRAHVIGCWSCRHFRNQIRFLHQAMQRWEAESDDADAASPRLNDAAKARLKALMIDKQGER